MSKLVLCFSFDQARKQLTGLVVMTPQPGLVPMGQFAESTGQDPTLVSPTLTTSCLPFLLYSSASPWRAGWRSSTTWVYTHQTFIWNWFVLFSSYSSKSVTIFTIFTQFYFSELILIRKFVGKMHILLRELPSRV